MTMHLAKGFSTLRTNRKFSPKMTKANVSKWTREMHEFNRLQKQLGQPKLTFDEYVLYAHGKLHKKPANNIKSVHSNNNSGYRRDTPDYPSCTSGGGLTPKPQRMEYTGTLVKGIATMHKSNAVPIIDDQQAKDIANMRRG